MSVLLRPDDFREIGIHVRELVEVLKVQEPQQVSKDARGRHAPFRYARYLTRQLKSFAALLPPNTHHDGIPEQETSHAPSQYDSQDVMHASRAENYAATLGNQTPGYSGHAATTNSYVGYNHGNGAPLNISTNYGSYGPETAVSSSSATSMWDFRTESSNSLSGFPVDYSLLSFAQTVNDDARLSKDTPPPEETATQAWWQQMYPVSNAYAPDGMDWPMTAGDGRRMGTIPEQEYSSLRDDYRGS